MSRTHHADPLPPLDAPAADGLADRLFGKLATQVEWGLDRTRAVLEELGHPEKSFPTLHVGGTNGKGSVAAVQASVLSAGGSRVGLYTSPHLCSFAERFQIGGRPIHEDVILAAAREVREGVRRHGLTFFEAATVLAFVLFRREAVDVAVVEVGLGGRLDATNVLRPEVALVTNVALDHAQYLGGTLPEIAREKAGIVKEGVPFLTSEGDPELLEIFRAAAERVGAPFHRVDPVRDLGELESDALGNRFLLETAPWGELRLRSPLVGRHQAVNVAVAVRGLAELGPELRPDAGAVMEGVARVRWPGRMQVELMDGQTWVFDVAHNPAGARALAEALSRLGPPGPRVALVGILGDKDWRGMLPPLLERVDRVVLTDPPDAPPERRWDPGAVAAELAGAGSLEVERNLERAISRARAAAGSGGTVIVTGSHYTVGPALRVVGRPPWEA